MGVHRASLRLGAAEGPCRSIVVESLGVRRNNHLAGVASHLRRFGTSLSNQIHQIS